MNSKEIADIMQDFAPPVSKPTTPKANTEILHYDAVKTWCNSIVGISILGALIIGMSLICIRPVYIFHEYDTQKTMDFNIVLLIMLCSGILIYVISLNL